MLVRIVYAWIANVVALGLAAYLIDEIEYSDDYWVLIVAALVLALVGFFLKPVLRLLALPLIPITFGLVLFAINLLLLYLTDWLIPGFVIGSLSAGLVATVVVTAVNWILGLVLAPIRR